MKTKRNNLLFGLFATALLVVGCTDNNTNSNKNSSSSSGDATVSTNSASTGGVNKGDTYTYHSYTTTSPSNWNELTYKDENDTQIMDYIGSSFFVYDFKFDEDGEIVSGEFEMKYSAATKLEDVTTDYAGKDNWGIPANAKSSRAYKITLRDDLKWDDGTSIAASDFVYSMQEQLNPLFFNYRADSYYKGSTIIHNAQGYLKQKSIADEVVGNLFDSLSEAMNVYDEIYLDYDAITDALNEWFDYEDITYEQFEAAGYLDYYFALYEGEGENRKPVQATNPDGTLAYYPKTDDDGNYITDDDGNYVDDLESPVPLSFFSKYDVRENENKKIKVTQAMIDDYNSMDMWNPSADEEMIGLTIIKDYEFPEVSWNDVGFFVGDNENEFVIILDKPLQLLKEDGSLSYKAAYSMASLPLVKRDLYESCKQEPQAGSSLWTSNYNSSVETTASWGPYKLTEFQAGKAYALERNPYWYGYNMDLYKGQYQTTNIEVETIKEWSTAWLAFQKGELTLIGMDVSISQEYKNSSRAIFTPDDYVGSLQLQSSYEALAARESDNVNKTILSYPEFRKAISLAVNRTEYNNSCTTSSLPGLGLFNSMHYYDVENGGVYRNTDYAKEVLCEVYGIDVSQYGSLDEAVESITGYDLKQAKELVTEAYNKALADGEIDADDKVVITFGSGADNESVRRVFNFLTTTLTEMVKGTPLEGRLETTFEDHQTKWADDFRAGGYDICLGGWTGAAWDPGYFLLAYISDDYMYSTGWDTSNHNVTFTMPELADADYAGEGVEETMSILEWWDCLNGQSGAKYDWSEGAIPNDARLALIARLEKEILLQYYTVPVSYSFGARLLSYQVEYITTEYNTFMAYGGIRYMTYNFTDAQWSAYLANNNLDYKL